jgi:hypothetical protein
MAFAILVRKALVLIVVEQDLDKCWEDLLKGEAARSRAINANIREIKESLRRRFGVLANSCEAVLQGVSVDLAALDGALEAQLSSIAKLQERVGKVVKESLPEILGAEQECHAANVEESDHTVYTYEDLEFETGLVREAVAKKKAFLENQVSLLS